MALQLLHSLSSKQLPVTFSDRGQVAAVRALVNAQCVIASFVKELGGAELAVVHEITSHGRTVLATGLQTLSHPTYDRQEVRASQVHPDTPAQPNMRHCSDYDSSF